MKNSDHMPYFRVDPVYVVAILLLTIIGIYAGKQKYLSMGILSLAKLPLLIIGIILIILEKAFGQEYLVYKSKVNRYIPWFPKKL